MSAIMEGEMSHGKSKPRAELNELSSENGIYRDKTCPHDRASLPAAAEVRKDPLVAVLLPRIKKCSAVSELRSAVSACCARMHVDAHSLCL